MPDWQGSTLAGTPFFEPRQEEDASSRCFSLRPGLNQENSFL
jgi:hypothetical protein